MKLLNKKTDTVKEGFKNLFKFDEKTLAFEKDLIEN